MREVLIVFNEDNEVQAVMADQWVPAAFVRDYLIEMGARPDNLVLMTLIDRDGLYRSVQEGRIEL